MEVAEAVAVAVAPQRDNIMPWSELEFHQILKLFRKVNYYLIWVAAISMCAFDFYVDVDRLPPDLKMGLSQPIENFFTELSYSFFSTHVPLGYFPLIIMSCFMSLEKHLTPEILQFGGKVSDERNFTLTSFPDVVPPPAPESSSGGPSLKGVALIILLYVVGISCLSMIYETVDLSRYGRMVLGSSYVGAISAVFTVLGSLALRLFPKFERIHKGLCEVWVALAVGLTGFLLMFIITNFMNILREMEEPRPRPRRLRRLRRLEIECMFFLRIVYYMLCYLPGIHKDLVVIWVMERPGGMVLEAVMMNWKCLWEYGEILVDSVFGAM